MSKIMMPASGGKQTLAQGHKTLSYSDRFVLLSRG